MIEPSLAKKFKEKIQSLKNDSQVSILDNLSVSNHLLPQIEQQKTKKSSKRVKKTPKKLSIENLKKEKPCSQKQPEFQEESNILKANLSIPMKVKELTEKQLSQSFNEQEVNDQPGQSVQQQSIQEQSYDEDFRNSFISDRIDLIKNMPSLERNKYEMLQSEELNISSKELRSWILQYEIVEQMKYLLGEKSLKQQQTFNKFGEIIVRILEQNEDLTYDMLKKLVENSLKSLHLNFPLTKKWINLIVNQNFEKLKSHIITEKIQYQTPTKRRRQLKLLKKQLFPFKGKAKSVSFQVIEEKSNSEVSIQQNEIEEAQKKPTKKQIMMQKVTKKEKQKKIEKVEQTKPLSFKIECRSFEVNESAQKKIAEAIDEMLESKIQRLIEQRSKDTKFPVNILKEIYRKYGKNRLPEKSVSPKKYRAQEKNKATEEKGKIKSNEVCSEEEDKQYLLDLLELKFISAVRKLPHVIESLVMQIAQKTIEELNLSDYFFLELCKSVKDWVLEVLNKYGIKIESQPVQTRNSGIEAVLKEKSRQKSQTVVRNSMKKSKRGKGRK